MIPTSRTHSLQSYQKPQGQAYFPPGGSLYKTITYENEIHTIHRIALAVLVFVSVITIIPYCLFSQKIHRWWEQAITGVERKIFYEPIQENTSSHSSRPLENSPSPDTRSTKHATDSKPTPSSDQSTLPLTENLSSLPLSPTSSIKEERGNAVPTTPTFSLDPLSFLTVSPTPFEPIYTFDFDNATILIVYPSTEGPAQVFGVKRGEILTEARKRVSKEIFESLGEPVAVNDSQKKHLNGLIQEVVSKISLPSGSKPGLSTLNWDFIFDDVDFIFEIEVGTRLKKREDLKQKLKSKVRKDVGSQTHNSEERLKKISDLIKENLEDMENAGALKEPYPTVSAWDDKDEPLTFAAYNWTYEMYKETEFLLPPLCLLLEPEDLLTEAITNAKTTWKESLNYRDKISLIKQSLIDVVGEKLKAPVAKKRSMKKILKDGVE